LLRHGERAAALRPGQQPSREEPLREVLTVSRRGQITLPAGIRRHLGIAPGGVVIVEECEGGLRLKPAAVLAVAHYSDAQIAEWDRADVLSTAERQVILQRLLQH
jgi:AbrB family looped-hinge helix DNA binding protein